MIAYHIDRSGILKTNQILELNTDIKLDHVFNNFNNSFSNQGKNYLNQSSSSSFWELALEYIRINYFPHYLSRFQALFGTKTYEDALIWKGLFSAQSYSKINICKIEFETTCNEFDARWMTTPPPLPVGTNSLFNNNSLATTLQYAYKYWNKEKTDFPLNELIIELPIKVIEII